jgi:hypothetical protein
MNLTQKLLKLLESFVTGINHDNTYVEFFVNPDRKELQAVGPDIRFIIDTRGKKFYVFNAWSMLHDWAGKYLKIKNMDDPNFIRGVGVYEHGILQTYDVDTAFGALATLVSNDYSWTKYYYSDFEKYRQEKILRHGDSV